MFTVTLSFGQGKYGATDADSVECITQLSLYEEFVKQKNYKDAYPGWKKACEVCPKSRKSLYINGVKMYRRFIQKEKDPVRKAAYLDTLMTVYDNRIANFGQEGYVLGRKANDLYRFDKKKERTEEANAMFKKSMDLRKEKTEAGALSGYYLSLYDLVKAGKAEKAAMLEEYLPLSDLTAQCIAKAKMIKDTAKAAKAVGKYEKAKTNIDEMFVKVGDCASIVDIFTTKLAASPDDMELKKKIMKVCTKRNCTDNDLFKQVAKDVHAASPSHETAFGIGKVEMSDKKYSSALNYFKQAIELCGEDCPDKAMYNLGAAQASLKTGNLQGAYSYAGKALALDPSDGSGYLIQAQAVAKTKCGTNALELKYVYWVAYDLAAKAKAKGGEVGNKASRLMSAYKANWPDKTELFNFGVIDKGTVRVGCWINASTEVREKGS